MNVPETMNEVLDMSDDEGIKNFNFFYLFVVVRNVCLKNPRLTHIISWIWSLHICYCCTLIFVDTSIVCAFL